MKITILNGNPVTSPFDAYLARLETGLAARGHSLTRLDLRDLPLHYCIGCWGCWVKTPGACLSQDASLEVDRAIINADFVLYAAPLKMGFPSALLKMALDKHLPLIHPYIELDHMEMHHLRRYPRSPRLGLLLEKEPSTDERDLQIVADIFCRLALNFKTHLEFCQTTEQPVEAITARILAQSSPLPLPARLAPAPGAAVHPPARLTLFNGSPRGKRANSAIFLDQFAQGFGGPVETRHLIYARQLDEHVRAFDEAECVWIGFPLYTDAMPAIVKNFIETLEPFVGRPHNPPLGFIVQSGFVEGQHSRYVERYLEKLASRLGSPYLGTIVKGSGEGVRVAPPAANKALFADLQALGAGFARDGRLDPRILAHVASPERLPIWLWPVFKLMLNLPVTRAYFDDMLKKNGTYERRFAQPFVE